jgi:hypothetical protein
MAAMARMNFSITGSRREAASWDSAVRRACDNAPGTLETIPFDQQVAVEIDVVFVDSPPPRKSVWIQRMH